MTSKNSRDESSIETDLINSATQIDYSDILQNYAESSLDALVDNEIIDTIPVIKTLAKLHKGVIAYRERLFLKKIAYFLMEANKLSKEERKNWLKKVKLDSPKEQKKVGEKLLIIIDGVNDNYKALIIGKLFRAYVKGKIGGREDFFFLCELVEGCRTHILEELAKSKPINEDTLILQGIKRPKWTSTEDITEAVDKSLRRPRMTTLKSYPASDYTPSGQLLIKVLRDK